LEVVAAVAVVLLLVGEFVAVGLLVALVEERIAPDQLKKLLNVLALAGKRGLQYLVFCLNVFKAAVQLVKCTIAGLVQCHHAVIFICANCCLVLTSFCCCPYSITWDVILSSKAKKQV
jgi:hypothetical protein